MVAKTNFRYHSTQMIKKRTIDNFFFQDIRSVKSKLKENKSFKFY
jgi:hypothetical protein